jgi:oligosaccharide repeat unit polymerase
VTAAAILVAGLGVVLLLPLVWRALTRRFDPFEPIVLFVLAYGAMFVARPSAMLVHGDFRYGVDLQETFPLLTLLTLVGGVAFLVAYELRLGPALVRLLPAPHPIATRGAVLASIVLIAISAIAFVAIVVNAGGLEGLRLYFHGRGSVPGSGSLTELGGYVWYAARLGVPASLLLIALALRERSRSIATVAIAVLLATLIVIVPMGSRISLLPLVGGALVFVYLRRRTRPSVPLLAMLAVVALFASYAAVIVREPVRRAEAGEQFKELASRPYRVFDLVLYRGDAEMAPVLAGALTAIPEELGYRYGMITIGEAFIRPVPRQLWHGKPRVPSEQVVERVWPQLHPYFQPSFSPLLSFYWDFGIAGVAVGMALLGLGWRTFYEWLRRHDHSFAAQLIFAAGIWYVVVSIRDQPFDAFGFAFWVVVPLILIERFSGARLASLRPFRARARTSAR